MPPPPEIGIDRVQETAFYFGSLNSQIPRIGVATGTIHLLDVRDQMIN
jgi:hypothetical protein